MGASFLRAIGRRAVWRSGGAAVNCHGACRSVRIALPTASSARGTTRAGQAGSRGTRPGSVVILRARIQFRTAWRDNRSS